MKEEWVRELAKCDGFDILLPDDNNVMLIGGFSYDGGGSQGFGYDCIDMNFIIKLMRVFRVDQFKDMAGEPCWVTHNHHNIKLVEPLMKNEGLPFNVEKWAEERFK